MKKMNRVIISAMTTFIALSATSATIAATNGTADQNSEKCYGIVKAGMNDCATATASCAGSATKDKQSDAFLFVQKGICDKIAGGVLAPKEDKKS